MATDCIAQVTFECQGLSQPIVARFDRLSRAPRTLCFTSRAFTHKAG